MRKTVVSTKIQSNFRRYTMRSSFTRLRHAVVLIQAALRAMAARYELRYRRRHMAATKLEVSTWYSHTSYKSKCSQALFLIQVSSCRPNGAVIKIIQAIRSSKRRHLSHNADGGAKLPGENFKD